MPLRVAFDLDGVLADMEGALRREAEAVFGESTVRRMIEGAARAPAEPPVGDDAASRAAAGPPLGGAGGEKPGQAPAGQAAPADPAEAQVLPSSRLQLTARQQHRLWTHVGGIQDFWESLNEIEDGSVAALAALASERRWEVIFLTRRPDSAGATPQLQTQRWLEARGFKLPSVYVVQGSRGRIAAALSLDFVIDDTPQNCLDVVIDSKARAVLVWRDDEKRLPAAARRLGIGVVKSVGECLGILAQVDAPGEEKPKVLARVLQALGLRRSRI